MQGEITIEGASIGKVIDLTGDLVLTGGNLVNPQISLHGFDFHRVGVLRAPVINESRDPADWPANFTHDGPLHLSWHRLEPYQLAVDILDGIDQRSSVEGLEMWNETLDRIFSDPAIGYLTLVADIGAWAKTDPGGGEGVMNTLDIDSSFKRLQAKYFAGQTFNQIKTELLSKSRETWDGVKTELVEEYS